MTGDTASKEEIKSFIDEEEAEYERERLAAHRAITGSEENGPDGHARIEFTCGLCHVFAAVLHDITGWDIVAEYESNGEDVAHVWVIDGNGRAVDINGVHDGGWARTPYSGEKAGPTRPFSRQDCEGQGPHAVEDYGWAAEIIATYPRLYGIQRELSAVL